MAISTDCPNCGKKYKAPDQLLGQRVRCRGCGTVFALSTGGDGGEADMSALAELAGSGDPAAALAAAVGANAAAEETNAVFDSAFTDFTPTVRPNRPFYYPLAHVLDQYLPTALFVGAGLWVTIEAFNRNQANNPIWVPFLRLFLLTVGYFAIVLPLGYLAISKAAKLAKFELPPQAKYRSAATLALPYGIVCLLWLTVGNFADAVPGVILGLAVVMGAVWLLIRIRPPEAAVTLGLSSGAFLASLLILVGVLSGVNLIAQAAAGESKARLAESPIGPGMAWDVPAPPPKPGATPTKPTDSPTVVASNDTPSPDQPDAGTAIAGAKPTGGSPGTQADPAVSPATPSSPTEPTSPPVAVAAAPAVAMPGVAPKPPVAGAINSAANNDPLGNSKLFGQAPSAPRPPEVAPPPVADVPPDPDPSIRPNPATYVPPAGVGVPGVAAVPGVTALPGAVGPGSVAVAGDDPVSAEIRATRSPLVSAVRSGAAVGPFERLVPTLTPSPVALVVKRSAAGGADLDQLDVWNFDQTARLGSVEVKRDVGKGVGVVDGAPSYAVSPDGAAWARVTSFPSLGLESTPLSGNASPVRVSFKDLFGDATILGYTAADRVLVRWRNGDNARLELWDLKSKQMTGRVLASYHPTNPGNGVVSPDGKLYAAVVGVPNRSGAGFKTHLAVYDLTRPPGRTVPILGMEPEQAVKPTGMAFSSDMKSLGLLYEQNGNTVLMSYKLGSLSAMTPIPIAAGKVPVLPAAEKAANRLSSVADGRGWLVGGNAVLDADTGNLLGTLGVTKPCSHVTVGAGVELISGEGGQRSVAVVTFNKAAIGKPPAAPAGALPAAHPAAGQLTPPPAAPVGAPVAATAQRTPAPAAPGLPTAAGR